MFNWIEVWGLCWPVKNSEMVILELVGCHFAGMLGVIVLLKDDFNRG